MRKYFFWQNWPKSNQTLYKILLLLFSVSCLVVSYTWFKGIENILHWDIISELDEIPTTLNKFSEGNLKFTVNGNAYIIKEQFLASSMTVNYGANYFFLLGYLLSICLLLTSLTTLKRYFFLGGMTIFVVVLLSFRWEILQVGGFTNQTTFLILFILYVGLAYYFNEFGEDISLVKRYVSFVVLTLIVGVIITFGAKVQHSALAVASYGILSAMILSVIFIFLISHEILSGLVWVVSNAATKGKNSLGPLFIVSTIYLLNVGLIFLKNTNVIDWNGLIISPFLLFFVSLLLGFWGFKKYCDSGNFIDFKTSGAWLYIGLGIITLVTLSFSFATGNDSLTEVLADAIAYSHLIMGLAFFVHILVNFIQPLQKGLEVHKIIYKPIFSPFSIVRIIAISAIIVLLAKKHYFPVFQTLAGYNNAIADYYRSENDLLSAETFYKKAIGYDFQNHQSNYAMASLAVQTKDEINAEYFFKQALLKNPSVYAFGGRTKALLEEDRYFEALFNLKDGIKKFPNSVELLTNLAYLHARAKGGSDSTLYYLNEAQKQCSGCDITETNLLAFWAKNGDKQKVEEQLEKTRKSEYISKKANEIACANRLGEIRDKAILKINKDSSLSVSEFAVLYNLSVNSASQLTINAQLLTKIQQKPQNQGFYEDLQFAKASQNYYRESRMEGIKELASLANDSTLHSMLYNRTLGIWFLQQGVFDKAINYLAKSGDKISVEFLQQPNNLEIVKNAQKQQADSLLIMAKTQNDFEKVIGRIPLNPLIIKSVANFYNEKLKKPNEAYQMLFNALSLNDSSVDLWKTYALQSLSMGLRDYAEDGLKKLQGLTTPADYQSFLSIYQAKKTLMEKNDEGFK